MERGRGRYIAPRNPENSGSSSGLIVLLLLCCCSVLVVLGIYGAAEGSDNNKTGVETLQELFEGKITLEDVFSNIEKGGDTSVPCQGSWSNWGACSKPCGGGTRSRTWTTTAEPLYGGAACPSPLTQEEACNTGACPPEPCEGSWSNWSACSASCGGGIKTKTWTTSPGGEPKYGGTACPSPKIQSADCNTQACPIDCVGEWEDRHGFCDLGCGTALETTFYYDIKTSAAHGGDACPHAQDATETQNCDLPSCPTVDTTETINGVKYDVKYYDSADGHSAYMVVYTDDINYPKNTAYWNGQMVAEIGDHRYVGTNDPTTGSDGHGYIRGDKKKGPYGTKSNHVVKRSQQPILQPGTCVLNKATEYTKKLDGYSDYECAGMCGGMQIKSTCESSHKGCDYVRDGVPSYQVSSRSGTVLSGACKWLGEGETQEIEPQWKVESDFWTPKKVDGTFLKTVDGVEMGIYYTKDEARDKTENKCLKECFNDPECTGVNTIFPSGGEGNKCELFTGDLGFSRNGSSWTGARGFKITRNYE
jgi:hypothetical protein